MSAETVTVGNLDMTCLATGSTLVAQVRSQIEMRLGEWRLLHLAHDVYLIADKMVSNAVRHAADCQIRVQFTREPGAVLLGVCDPSNEMPQAKPVIELSLQDIEPDPHALDPGHDDGDRRLGSPAHRSAVLGMWSQEDGPKREMGPGATRHKEVRKWLTHLLARRSSFGYR